MKKEHGKVDTSTSNTRGDTSTSTLLSNLATDMSELMRGEVYLARAELREAVKDAKKGALGIGIGTAVLTGGVLSLIAFLVLALADGLNLELWLAALIVGVIATLSGLLLLKSGANKLSAENLAPQRLMASFKKDKQHVRKTLS